MSLKFEVRRTNTSFRYFRHGANHRNDGPSVALISGDMYWMEYNVSHRMDGPADIYKVGPDKFFIRGVEYNKKEYESKI